MKNSVNLPWFALVYIATIVGLIAFMFLVALVFNIKIPMSAIQLVPVLVATVHVGKMYFEDYQEVPDAKEAWVASWRMTLVEIAIALPVLTGLFFLTFGMEPLRHWSFLLPLALIGALFVFWVSLWGKKTLFLHAAIAAQTQQNKEQNP
ncbi:hypothetical protein TRICHSKD4_5187 [Roseibium sp. TrichSKD4]|uniref:ABZJ_00895 family protein n=1 Tax=Roseibium sp. TrichSKD4 TaxID=744980 RepID=UPI0001E5754A|nr:ABZJ_00895 family protein [Roseibium sp. TrichSKD4]EFO29361.1 hypothetical protein TRICHSKD4_5187 [Roseibium sp. TrichSKD4]